MRNVDSKTVEGFGDEWSRYDQTARTEQDLQRVYDSYFQLFPWGNLPDGAAGMDVGCGSGRWARFVARHAKVRRLLCVDASEKALAVARENLGGESACEFLESAAGDLGVANDSLDFAYSLGVLHHTPRPEIGLADAVSKLKPGAPFLLYVYYALDNRPPWFRAAWRASDGVRRVVSSLPFPLRAAVATGLAAGVYWPAARVARALDRWGVDVSHVPLSSYRHKSFYVMRTDSLDRFGTRLEKRFTREQVVELMESSGLENVVVQQGAPYYCAIGFRR